MYRVAELFAGTGAFSIGFESTGKCTTVFANDFDANSKHVFDQNMPVRLTLGDVNDLEVQTIPRMDILTGGFPCQPFSIAGLRKGFDDKRSNVFWTILRVIDCHKPRCVVLENVKNLVSHDDGNTFRTIQAELQQRGYHIHHKVLNTYKVSRVPQNRERIYIVCFLHEEDAKRFQFPQDVVDPPLPLLDLLETEVPAKYYYKSTLKVWDIVEKGVTKDVRDHNTIYQLRRQYIRENKKNVCPTLTANMGGGGHNGPLIKEQKGIRKLTPRECFNMQGFPSTYNIQGLSDTALYKLAGNAVSVSVVSRIAHSVVGALQ